MLDGCKWRCASASTIVIVRSKPLAAVQPSQKSMKHAPHAHHSSTHQKLTLAAHDQWTQSCPQNAKLI